MSNVCLIVLIGIPGAGKTHFCKYVSDNFYLNNTEITCISYDDYEKYVEATVYKNFRSNVYKKVDNLISSIFEKISREINTHNQLIIIDDNMYYRSMRRSYYNLAKNYSIGFCQIYINCNIDVAISRNNLRTADFVSPKIIYEMAEKLEAPSVNNSWEKYFCIMDSDKSYNEHDLEIVRDLIQKAINDPVKLNEEPSNTVVHNFNLIHKIDLILRKLISRKMKNSIVANVDMENLKLLSNELIHKKKLLLDGIKSCELLLPEYENEEQLENIFYKYINDS